MSYQPNQPHQLSQTALAFDRDEWELIVTLPRRVLVAAGQSEPAFAHRSVAEGLAGIEAIAAGLGSPSPLVREVVGAIYAESGRHSTDEPGGEVGIVQTLAACRYASEVLAQRCQPEDAAAYRDWLSHIAAAVTGAARSAPAVPVPVPTGRVGVAENRFLYALGGVLRP